MTPSANHIDFAQTEQTAEKSKESLHCQPPEEALFWKKRTDWQ